MIQGNNHSDENYMDEFLLSNKDLTNSLDKWMFIIQIREKSKIKKEESYLIIYIKWDRWDFIWKKNNKEVNLQYSNF